MPETEQTGFNEWAILELMGHRRLGGFVREVQVAGAGFLRIDVPGDVDGETHSTQFYPPSSVYCLTPVSEAAARIVARSSRPEPVQRWELPQPKAEPRCECGRAWSSLCGHCGETHPCSCQDEEDAELAASRRGYAFAGEGKTDQDDF
jgi:hypothetical protein